MTPTTPTQADPLISDDLLADLATQRPGEERGDYSDTRRAIIAMALPEIATELLAWRRAALSLAFRPEAIAARLDDARRTIRAPDPIMPRALREACETLMRHSSDPFERQAATEVLTQIREVA